MPCGWYVEDSRAQAIAHRDRIEALGADRVFAVDAASTYSRPGPRLVDGTELLAHLLHPGLVEPPPGSVRRSLGSDLALVAGVEAMARGGEFLAPVSLEGIWVLNSTPGSSTSTVLPSRTSSRSSR